jgi:hypothetical protein
MALDRTIVDEWYRVWNERFSRYLNASELLFKPIQADAICRAAGLRPAQLLNVKLEKMTLADWSELLMLALQDRGRDGLDYAPLWMAVPALLRLGLGAGIPALSRQLDTPEFRAVFSERRDLDEEAKQLNEWFSGSVEKASATPRPVAFVLARRDASAVKGWLPGSRYGGVGIERDKLDSFASLIDRLVRFVLPDFDMMVVLNEVDEPIDPSSAKDDPVRELAERLGSRPLFQVLSYSAPEISSDHPVIRNPLGLDEAMERALQILQRASWSAAAS